MASVHTAAPATEDSGPDNPARTDESGAVLPLGSNPTRTRPICGTEPGYTKHLYSRERPCDACRNANADRQAERRAANPRHRRRALIESRALHAAHNELKLRHASEFEALLKKFRGLVERAVDKELDT